MQLNERGFSPLLAILGVAVVSTAVLIGLSSRTAESSRSIGTLERKLAAIGVERAIATAVRLPEFCKCNFRDLNVADVSREGIVIHQLSRFAGDNCERGEPLAVAGKGLPSSEGVTVKSIRLTNIVANGMTFTSEAEVVLDDKIGARSVLVPGIKMTVERNLKGAWQVSRCL